MQIKVIAKNENGNNFKSWPASGRNLNQKILLRPNLQKMNTENQRLFKKIGIALYDIGMDGCINGVYTNQGAAGAKYTETLRKTDASKKEHGNNIQGDYDCLWFDLNNQRVTNCDLEIRATNQAGNIFEFTWIEQQFGTVFEGIGYQMNDRQIAVSYCGV